MAGHTWVVRLQMDGQDAGGWKGYICWWTRYIWVGRMQMGDEEHGTGESAGFKWMQVGRQNTDDGRDTGALEGCGQDTGKNNQPI